MEAFFQSYEKGGSVMQKVLILVIVCMASLAFAAGGAWGFSYVRCVDPGGGSAYTSLQDALAVATQGL